MNVNSSIEDTNGPWYLDDLSVGLRFRSGSSLTDGQQMIDFARQFDPQPFHLDAELATLSSVRLG